MLPIILKDDIAERIRQQAQQRGYDTPEAYLLDLVDADTDVDDADEMSVEEIEASIKRGFKDVLLGRVYSKEEYERMMAEDD